MNRTIVLAHIIFLSLNLNSQPAIVINVGVDDFRELIANDTGSLIDVRTQQEYDNGHIENAGQLNYYALDFNKKLLLLPKNKPVFLYCNTGYRSKKAAKTLISNGYRQVYNLEKGIMAWNLANYKVVIEKNAQPFLANKIEKDEYYAFLNNNTYVLIDFYAPWCAPCKTMMPAIDSLEVENIERINVLKVNVDASKKLVRELQINGVPQLRLYKKGELIKIHNGFMNSKNLKLFVNTLYKDY